MDSFGTKVLPATRLVVREEHHGRVARVVLVNPPDNAMDVTMLAELNRALAALAGWPDLAAVVLEGDGSTFSTGLSPSHRRPPYGDELVRSFLTAARQLAALETIQIACLRGRCFGAGLELALLSHFVFCDARTVFALPDAALAAFPLLAPALLPERVGRTRAEEWMITGRGIDAEEALGSGLVTGCAGGWDNVGTLVDQHLAKFVLSRPPAACRTLAKALSFARVEKLDALLPELERLFEERVGASADFAEGLSAALRGRPPRWNGPK